MAWLTIKTRPPQMYYLDEFGRSMPNGVGISRENPQNWGALGPHLGMRGVADL